MSEIFNIDAEQAVLGTLLIDPKSMAFVSLLDTADFSVSAHGQIFSLIADAAQAGRWLSPVMIAPTIRDLKFGPLTASYYVSRLLTLGVPLSQLPDYIAVLKELAARRLLVGMADAMKAFAMSPTSSLGGFVGDLIGALDGINSSLRVQKRTMHQIGDMAMKVLENLKANKKPESISTGLKDLDRIVGGWHRRELGVIAGRPSMGKSAFALSTLRLAGLRGINSLFFSMEMHNEAVSMRMLSDAVFNRRTPIPYNLMDQQKVVGYDLSRLEEVGRDLLNLPVHVDTARGLSVSEIGVRARRRQDELERQGKTLDLIVIDHLGKIKSTDRYAGNRVHETGEKTNALANLAAEIDIGVIALSQLNRGPEGREDKRPGNTDMRDSGNIEEDADMVAFLYRPAYYLERTKNDDPEKETQRIDMLEIKRNVLEVIVSKNRRGPICTQEFFIDVANNVVRDRV